MKAFDRPRAAALVLALVSAVSAAAGFFRIGAVPDDRVDWTTSFGRRLEGVRKELPPLGTVGWLTDETGESEVWTFYQTEYALAPVRVARGTGAEFVVGIFRSAVAAERAGVPAGLALARDFGNGIRLYRAVR